MTAASIVLYNPNIPRVIQSIKSIYDQVDIVILVDNGDSEKTKKQLSNILNDSKIVYICNGGNKGIAYAMNRAVEYCLRKKIMWLLTLDQDSICPSALIKTYKKYINMANVSIICCAINYNNQEVSFSSQVTNKYSFVNECITSASYINTNDCLLVGGFDEKMFIDRVDFEYCYRILNAGRKILETNEIVLDHQLGDLKINQIGSNKVHVGGHSSFRKFYMARNLVYCHRKHPEFNSLKYCTSKEFKLLFKTIIYENHKIQKTLAIFRGILSGINMQISKDNWICP